MSIASAETKTAPGIKSTLGPTLPLILGDYVDVDQITDTKALEERSKFEGEFASSLHPVIIVGSDVSNYRLVYANPAILDLNPKDHSSICSPLITPAIRINQEFLSPLAAIRKKILPFYPAGVDTPSNHYDIYVFPTGGLIEDTYAQVHIHPATNTAMMDETRRIIHDVRGPLTSISGYSQLLELALLKGDTDQAINYNKSISLGLHRMNGVVSDEIEGIELFRNYKSEPIGASSFLQSVVEENTELTRVKDVVIETNFAEGPSIIKIVPALSSVFKNLIGNAIDAMEGSKNKKITISSKAVNKSYLIKIQDNGTGMSQFVLERCFWPGFSTKEESKQRSGVGLSICRIITSKLGGHLTVDSEVGVGTTFTLSLPLYQTTKPVMAAA